ncbi:uncharacterized protein ACB058_003352 [Synchiropus picturatus]
MALCSPAKHLLDSILGLLFGYEEDRDTNKPTDPEAKIPPEDFDDLDLDADGMSGSGWSDYQDEFSDDEYSDSSWDDKRPQAEAEETPGPLNKWMLIMVGVEDLLSSICSTFQR